MSNLGNRIREVREEKGWSQEHLADSIKPERMAQQSIQHIESGKTKNPKPETVKKIAEALEISADWLLVGDKVKKYDPTYFLPILSFQEVINYPYCMELVEEKDNKHKFLMIDKGYENCYVIFVPNDLMEPRFKKGDALIVAPLKNPTYESFVIAHRIGAPQAMLKKYVVDGANRYLFSLKGNIERICIDETIKIVGVVVRKRSPDDIIESN